MMTTTRTRALCCECGNVRSVSTSAVQRRLDPYSDSEGRAPENLAGRHERGMDLGMEPYWRCLRLLKCSACGGQTRHANIRQDEHRDYAEGQDRSRDLDRLELGARLHRLELAGVDVRWDAADEWPERAVIELHQYRDPSGDSWLVVLSERAEPDTLTRRLVDVERAIDRREMPTPATEWQPADDCEWRGTRFAR